jgi:MATE family multidrug resistance protein
VSRSTHLFPARLRAEAGQIITLGWPIMIAQVAQDAMGFIDTFMASLAGPSELAAIALGGSIWLPLMLTLCGVLMATTPLVAQQVGAGNEKASARTLAQALTVAAALSVMAVMLLNNARPLLILFDVEPQLADKTAAYLSAISWGFPALLAYQALRSLSEGFGITQPLMRIAVIAMLANIPLNYVLIFGKLGLPPLGGVGCGYATSILFWLMLLLGIAHLRRDPRLADLSRPRQWQRPASADLIHFLRLGIPIGIALMIEASMFAIIALLLAVDGETVVAAHQITFSVTGLMFMLPLSVAMAMTIRVGQLVGRGERSQARFSAHCGLGLTVLIAAVNAATLVLAGRLIASAYTEVTAIIELTVTLMGIAALFQLTDALQVGAGGALRGYKDTAITLLVVFIAYWLIGLPAGHLLARAAELGAAGYWWGLLIGLSTGAVLLLTRLYRISHVDPSPRPAVTDTLADRLR